MSGFVVLAKLCTTLSECPKVETDGTTARVIGKLAPETEGIGPDEAAVSLPLDVLLAAVDAYDRRMRAEHGIGHVVAMGVGDRWSG